MILILLSFLSALITSPHSEVKRLGDDSWKVREEATKRLARMGMAAQPAIQLGLASKDIEVRKRCYLVSTQRVQINAERAKREVDAAFKPADFPFLDSILYDPTERRYLSNYLIREGITWRVNVNQTTADARFTVLGLHWQYRQATYQCTVEWVAAGAPVWVFRPIFAELRRRDEMALSNLNQFHKSLP